MRKNLNFEFFHDILYVSNKGGNAMHEEYDGQDTVKEKLLVAGLSELQKYGINDFSLRRVASACNVSCAAPYKHFKSKEAFIDEIFNYINSRWEMLQEQVLLAFEGDVKKQITETCITYIRFWIANPNFRASLMSAKSSEETPSVRASLNKSLGMLLNQHFALQKADGTDMEKTVYVIRSLVYGALLMLEDNELENKEETIALIRSCIEKQLEKEA